MQATYYFIHLVSNMNESKSKLKDKDREGLKVLNFVQSS